MRMHVGTFFAGALYLILGVVFVFESLGVWELTIGDLRYVGPLVLVVVGLAVVMGSLSRRP